MPDSFKPIDLMVVDAEAGFYQHALTEQGELLPLQMLQNNFSWIDVQLALQSAASSSCYQASSKPFHWIISVSKRKIS